MTSLHRVSIGPMDPRRFAAVVPQPDYEDFIEMTGRAAQELHGRVIWNINSTSRGGGVVELLRGLLGYARGAGVDARWGVIQGGADFFAITKRLHNHLHGFDGDGEAGEAERLVYERTLAANARALTPLVRPSDVVILHDPQTAGLITPLRELGAAVIWRCHIGLDRPNDRAREAWEFLRQYVENADALVFSRRSFAWEGLPAERIHVIHPSIDAFSPKNQDQTPGKSLSILARAGVISHHSTGRATFTRGDGSPGRVDRRATMLELEPLSPGDRVVAQVSRWDKLKDPLGVMHGFAEHVAEPTGAHLILAGPDADSVFDDPEGTVVYGQVAEAWRALAPGRRRHVHLVSLPMTDAEENAAVVNALQRHAEVVAQKSVAEGFGLTVAEAMWKQRPVVASRIGGIQDQIVDGESGVLLDDPADLEAFGAAVRALLEDRHRARQIGVAAQARVREHYLGPRHLTRYFELIQALLGAVAT